MAKLLETLCERDEAGKLHLTFEEFLHATCNAQLHDLHFDRVATLRSHDRLRVRLRCP